MTMHLKVLFVVLRLVSPIFCQQPRNIVYGVRYRNFTNYEGKLADGTCCDSPALNTNCPLDQCDTTFKPCATKEGGLPCGAFYTDTISTISDRNSFVVGRTIGDGRGSPSLSAYKTELLPGIIFFSIVALERSDNSSDGFIANFTFEIDWLDPLYTNPPDYRKLLLKTEVAELGVDVFSQCSRHYFGSECDVHCKPEAGRYVCFNNGTKNCTESWKGIECDVEACTDGRCHNGGTCNDIPSGFQCFCPTGFLGPNCEIEQLVITETKILPSLMSTVLPRMTYTVSEPSTAATAATLSHLLSLDENSPTTEPRTQSLNSIFIETTMAAISPILATTSTTTTIAIITPQEETTTKTTTESQVAIPTAIQSTQRTTTHNAVQPESVAQSHASIMYEDSTEGLEPIPSANILALDENQRPESASQDSPNSWLNYEQLAIFVGCNVGALLLLSLSTTAVYYLYVKSKRKKVKATRPPPRDSFQKLAWV